MSSIDDTEDINTYFSSLLSCIRSARRHEFVCDANVIETTSRHLQGHLEVVSSILAVVPVVPADGGADVELSEILEHLYETLHNLKQKYDQKISQRDIPDRRNYFLIEEKTGFPGRPKYQIPDLGMLYSSGMSWNSISRTCGVSARTVRRRRAEFGLDPDHLSRFSDMSDDQLDDEISHILQLTPNAGETYIQGALRARGIRIQRSRLRGRLSFLDPVGRALRKRRALRRRTYNVEKPNQLWHVDTNHKLIRWRFVFHGCIDGRSRRITHLGCADNNRKATALSFFLEGVRNCGLPLRVRGDRGVENQDIATFMIENRGIGKGSFIVGRSVHNQRIERLWAELNRTVSLYYQQLFQHMEQENLLNSNSDQDIFALHHVFMPRIKRSCSEFVQQWNNHHLRTEGNATPLQIWLTEGVVDSVVEVDIDVTTYGLDPNGPYPPIETSNNIVVPEIEFEIVENRRNDFNNLLDPLTDDSNHGINHYLEVLQFLNAAHVL